MTVVSAPPPKESSAPSAGKNSSATLGLSLMIAGALALVACATYLIKTNPHSALWQQGYDPTGMWWLSTLFASLPVVALLGAMAIFRLKAHVAAVIGLGTALTIAILVYHMPVRLALTTTVYGAGYGLFPICWIILPVIFLYQLTVKTGRFTALQESLTNITEDGRLQLLLIAFALGAFFEGTSGFGTPVAVCGAILISLGFKPIQAAGLSLIANTAPVAFGALGIPIITLSAVTGTHLAAVLAGEIEQRFLSHCQHSAGAACAVIQKIRARWNRIGDWEENDVRHQLDRIAGRPVFASLLVVFLVKFADQLLENGSH